MKDDIKVVSFFPRWSRMRDCSCGIAITFVVYPLAKTCSVLTNTECAIRKAVEH